MVAGQQTDIQVEYIHNANPLKNDEILAGMAPSSIIIDATGMGKDTPGSPITDKGLFRSDSIAWEFDYGESWISCTAEAQVITRNVRVEDGCVVFVHGWTQVVAQGAAC